MGRSMIAPCGLDCEACVIRKAEFDDEAAKEVAEWYAEEGWMKSADTEELRRRGPICRGCLNDRAVHWSPDCEILVCCVDKRKLKSCGGCEAFPCADIEAWAKDLEHHRRAFERLKAERRK